MPRRTAWKPGRPHPLAIPARERARQIADLKHARENYPETWTSDDEALLKRLEKFHRGPVEAREQRASRDVSFHMDAWGNLSYAMPAPGFTRSLAGVYGSGGNA